MVVGARAVPFEPFDDRSPHGQGRRRCFMYRSPRIMVFLACLLLTVDGFMAYQVGLTVLLTEVCLFESLERLTDFSHDPTPL